MRADESKAFQGYPHRGYANDDPPLLHREGTIEIGPLAIDYTCAHDGRDPELSNYRLTKKITSDRQDVTLAALTDALLEAVGTNIWELFAEKRSEASEKEI